MMRNPFVSALLTLLLALGVVTSASLGGPSPQSGPAVTVVDLCRDGGTVTLALDAQGRPVASRHPCPDCLAVPAAAPQASPAGWTRPETRQTAPQITTTIVIARPVHARPDARAPPRLI